MRCPTCGVSRKHHTPDMWREHQRMHKAHLKAKKTYERNEKKRRMSTKY